MVIVFVIDNFGEFTNGTTITAKRTKEQLERRGHSVRVVSAGDNEGIEFYRLKKRHIPIVSWASKKQNMYFAKPNHDIMKAAFTGADIVHFFMPFRVSKVGLRLAKKMDIPVTAAFHSQPENITYGMGLGRWGKPIAWGLYQVFKNDFYAHITHVHCPTTFIANEMRKQGYRNECHVISNGISDIFYPRMQTKSSDEFQILSIGRYALEKKQDVLLKAVSLSKYKERINVILAGKGPREKKLKRLAASLDLNCEFGFFNQDQLLEIIHNSDLYVHAAEAEIEGIACLEAIACGIVPIIAKSKKSATSQFALDERSIFPCGKPKELAKRIDYWLSLPEERRRMGFEYATNSHHYQLNHSIDLFEEMMKLAMDEHKRELVARSKNGKTIRKKIAQPIWKRMLSFLVYFLIAVPVLWVYIILFRGVRIKNRKRLTKLKSGAVLVSNHVHTLDSAMNGIAAFPKKPVFTGISANFKLPVAGLLVSILGTVPVPETLDEMKVFFLELVRQARRGRFVHFFPEGELVKYDESIRPFKRGAFQIAEEARVPVVPIGISFHEKKSIFPLFSPNKVILNIGEPIYPDIFKLKKESIQSLHEATWESMVDLIHI